MSFDIYVRLKEPNGSISEKEFDNFFDGRKNYSKERVGSFVYDDGDGTTFDWLFSGDFDGAKTPHSSELGEIASMSMPYWSVDDSSLVAAVRELEAFVTHFECLVFDPQAEAEWIAFDRNERLRSFRLNFSAMVGEPKHVKKWWWPF